MLTKEQIEKSIRDAVCEVTGKKDFGSLDSLIDKDSGIMPVNFLYIFDILEKELNLPVCKVFENNGYDVMCVKNLTDAIYSLQEK